MNNFKKTPVILSVIFFVILAFGFFFLYREVDSNHEKAQLATMELENEISLRNEAKLLNSSIETIKEDSALLGTHFAQSSDIVPFLDTIEGLAPKAGAKAETTSVDVLPDNAGLIIKVKASGSFKNIYKFLTLLENSQYELEFTEVDIQRESEGEIGKEGIPLPSPNWQAVFGIKLLSFIQ
jgi:hypothetical protein